MWTRRQKSLVLVGPIGSAHELTLRALEVCLSVEIFGPPYGQQVLLDDGRLLGLPAAREHPADCIEESPRSTAARPARRPPARVRPPQQSCGRARRVGLPRATLHLALRLAGRPLCRNARPLAGLLVLVARRPPSPPQVSLPAGPASSLGQRPAGRVAPRPLGALLLSVGRLLARAHRARQAQAAPGELPQRMGPHTHGRHSAAPSGRAALAASVWIFGIGHRD